MPPITKPDKAIIKVIIDPLESKVCQYLGFPKNYMILFKY